MAHGVVARSNCIIQHDGTKKHNTRVASSCIV